MPGTLPSQAFEGEELFCTEITQQHHSFSAEVLF